MHNISITGERTKRMNMIPCGESCKHQKDGYCCLESGGKLTGASGCRFFDAKKPAPKGGKKR